jgi:hypothetical protein
VARAPFAILSIAVAVYILTSTVAPLPENHATSELSPFLESPQITRANVTFIEHGLPAQTGWSITIHRSTFWTNFTRTSYGTTTNLSLPVGQYTFRDNASGFVGLPANGSFAVNGTNLSEYLNFTKFSYHAIFSERGLSMEANWSVVVNGTSSSSTHELLSLPEPNGTYAFTAEANGYTAVPSNGTFRIDGGDARVNLTFSALQYGITFLEEGLPTGSSWEVTLANTTQNVSGASISFEEPNGTYPFWITSMAGWEVTPENGSITVDGAAVQDTVTWSPRAAYEYSVRFVEGGLAKGTSWSVTLDGQSNSSTGSTVSFLEANGTYSYFVAPTLDWVPSPEGGQVTVLGASLQISLNFTRTELFPVRFTETGLPPGTSWTVNLTGVGSNTSVSDTVGFSLPDGNYSYQVEAIAGWSASPATGPIEVSGVAPAPIEITWSPVNVSWSVTFSEGGLPNGTVWAVSLAGAPQSAPVTGPTSNITFERQNGTYNYSVASLTGWTASTTGGSVTVAGAGVDVPTINWSVAPLAFYTVTFSETGLPTGDFWSVALNGSELDTSASLLSFQVPNGTYTYSLSLPSGYAANSTSGSVQVQGGPSEVWLTIQASASGGVTARIQLMESQGIELAVVWVLVGLSTLLWFLDRRRRAKAPSS